MRFTFTPVLIVSALLVCAAAQQVPHAEKGNILDAVSLPGQMWSANGTLSPSERNNVFSQSYFEQDANVFSTWGNSLSLTSYASFGTTFDTRGYSWNNKLQPSSGIKVNKYFRWGVVTIATAYAYEDRLTLNKSMKGRGRIDFVQYWFGWNSVANAKSRFPGSSWAIAGRFSPVEHGNMIEQGYITQGIIAKRFGRVVLVPYSELTLGHDSQRLDWENKIIYGAGLKAAVSKGEVYTDFGVGLLRENRFNSGQSANGIKIFTDFSYAWNLFGRKGR